MFNLRCHFGLILQSTKFFLNFLKLIFIMPTVEQGFPNTIAICWILVGGGSLVQNDVLSSFKLVLVKLKKKRRRRIRRNSREVHLFCRESLLRCVLQSCQWCFNWLISSHAFSSLFKMVSSWEKIGDDEKAGENGGNPLFTDFIFILHCGLGQSSMSCMVQHLFPHLCGYLHVFLFCFPRHCIFLTKSCIATEIPLIDKW